jgi:phage recombination protein Bet
MSNENAVVKADEKGVEYVPFGGQDKVKLSIAMVKNLIAVKTRTGKTCSDNDAIKFVAMCQARRLNPFEGDAFLIGYDGKEGPVFSLITAHQAFLKRAELNAEYDGMKSGVIIDRNGEMMDLEGDFYLTGDKVLGGWATVYFKNRKQPMHKRVRLARFQKSFGVWQDDGAGMICKCAEADALRSSFPTMLGGLYLKEETTVDVPKTSAPLFTASPSNHAAQNPEPVQEAEVVNPAKFAMEEPSKPSYNVLKAVRGLIKQSKLPEEEFITQLQGIGSIDESVTALDKIDQDTLQLLHDQFSEIVDGIKERINPQPTQD